MKALTLLSGGLDSVVATALARQTYQVVLALTFDYGQRAVRREIEAARFFADQWGIEHRVIGVNFIPRVSALQNSDQVLPTGEMTMNQQSADQVWVPNRNGVFINIAAAIAEGEKIDLIVCGFNREEAETFPDNSVDFIEAVNRSLNYSTCGRVQVISPTSEMNKVQMARIAGQKGIDMGRLWSCYQGGEEPCGVCESCLRLRRAIAGREAE